MNFLHCRRDWNLLMLMNRSTACLQRTSSVITSHSFSSPSATVGAGTTLRAHSGWSTCSPVGWHPSLALMKLNRVDRSHWGLTDFNRSGMMEVFCRGTRYSMGISWGCWCNDLSSTRHQNRHYLFEWILVIPDHDLGPDEPQELDEGVNMAQSDVSEWTVLGIDIVTEVEMERVLERDVIFCLFLIIRSLPWTRPVTCRPAPPPPAGSPGRCRHSPAACRGRAAWRAPALKCDAVFNKTFTIYMRKSYPAEPGGCYPAPPALSWCQADPPPWQSCPPGTGPSSPPPPVGGCSAQTSPPPSSPCRRCRTPPWWSRTWGRCRRCGREAGTGGPTSWMPRGDRERPGRGWWAGGWTWPPCCGTPPGTSPGHRNTVRTL